MNYSTHPSWSLAHLWSLAVEEQFYLVWPLILRVLGRRRAIQCLCGIMVLAPIVRWGAIYLGPWVHFLTVSDALAIGCILAAHKEQLYGMPMYRRVLQSRWFFLVPLVALITNFAPSYTFSCLAGQTIMNIAIALTVDWSVRNSRSLAGRILNLPSVSFLGVLSYSIYLWQQPFLNRNSHAFSASFPVNLLLALLLALLSYLCVETVFMRFRSRLEHRVFGPKSVFVATGRANYDFVSVRINRKET